MAVTINTNLASLMAQRRLANTTSLLGDVSLRLASGQRINKAADDAAGLAMLSSLETDSRVYTQGIRNISDGISLLNIAENALRETSSALTRIQELAEQAANGVYSATQRAALDTEAKALAAEITRIIETTEFNGLSLLDGSLSNGVRLQAGYGLTSSIVIDLGGGGGVTQSVGDGTFTAGVSFNDPGNNQLEAVRVIDVDRDGIADLMVADQWGGGSIRFQKGNGDGTFQSGITVNGASEIEGDDSFQMSDLNNDGNLDIVVGSGTEVDVFIGNGNGTFGARTGYTISGLSENIAVADFNNDGITDIITGSATSKLDILIGNGNGTFQAAVSFTAGASGAQHGWVAAADLNGDGNMDVISRVTYGDRLWVNLGNGNGTFQAGTSYQVGSQPWAAGGQITDINNDSILDIVTADRSDNTISILLGNGNGTFQARTTIATANAPSSSLVADLNNDGIKDLVTTSADDDLMQIFYGTGGGLFSAANNYASGNIASGLGYGDVNGDGVSDIVLANYDSTPSRAIQIFLANIIPGAVELNLEVDLTTPAAALATLTNTEAVKTALSAQIATIGAGQSRLGYAASNLQSARENYTAAASRIKDADIAAEAATATRLQILQQTGAAVLAQANQQPSIVLKLLGNLPVRNG